MKFWITKSSKSFGKSFHPKLYDLNYSETSIYLASKTFFLPALQTYLFNNKNNPFNFSDKMKLRIIRSISAHFDDWFQSQVINTAKSWLKSAQILLKELFQHFLLLSKKNKCYLLIVLLPNLMWVNSIQSFDSIIQHLHQLGSKIY